ncbi:PREDICTED: DNA ligase 3 [Ceratosolen solmsi marchali]|uniref:DNA ligase n=1 Tax=Ceratosolen solmsi marchali TaxID=326594 RepID=A0AAJ6YM87_9HYME|nr:PREDICTED: DNA ligase 3 [Ceratosolen solmsi marchali]
MSDLNQEEAKQFEIERADNSINKCEKCRYLLLKGDLMIIQYKENSRGEGLVRDTWYHVGCIFEELSKQPSMTKRIVNPEYDIRKWNLLYDRDKDFVMKKFAEFHPADSFKATKQKAKLSMTKETYNKKLANNAIDDVGTSSSKITDNYEKKDSYSREFKTLVKKKPTQDNMFSEFQRICDEISSCSSYLEKTAIVKRMFTKGSEKDGFTGDIVLWCRLLLPGTAKRIYNLQSKALIKLFARILNEDEKLMIEDLEEGDVAQTIKTFYQRNSTIKFNMRSELTLQEVDEFLEKLSTLTKEEEQIYHFKSILRRCTPDDLKMIIRLIKHDLRINAGPKHILEAIHDDAYAAFQVSRDLPFIIRRCLDRSSKASVFSLEKASTSTSLPAPSKLTKSPKSGKIASVALMTPVLPMLAEACKSVDMAMEKCPRGMLSEVKYDGERVQIHKMGKEFCYFSRSLKPVLAHKVNFLKDCIPKAFPEGDDLILDAEILLIDTTNGQPLPFGTLGVHKKAKFKNASVCLFVFDIIYYNGKSLMDRPIIERRELLQKKMMPIPNRIVLSEIQEINDSKILTEMILKTFKLRLEGLVLKSVDSKYEPGKRHWLKIKKDYLFEGAMADSADLVVVGAWYGTGHKGGIMSIFLMGCYDPDRDIWLTVTKVHTGHDDATLTELQYSLDMVKISKDPNLLPKWLRANKPMIPDFVARDPKNQPVWEITGAEFTNQGVHTADGISIRFPRVTRIREDKNWETATNLHELKELFNKSTESIDYSLLLGSHQQKRPADDDCNLEIKAKKQKQSSCQESSSPGDEKATNSRTININNSNEGLKMEIDEREEHKATVKLKGRDKNTMVNKSPGKILTKFLNKNKVLEEEEKERSKSSNDSEEENRAKFYSFIGTDYIEYSAAGSPLNWINDRKPPKYLPKDAKPINEPVESKMKLRCLLSNARVYIANDLDPEKRKAARRTLKTLGAAILSRAEQNEATHVIHGCASVAATILLEPTDIPKSARHVTESWIYATAANCKVENIMDHAVTLSGAYCSCPCPHHKD